MGADRFGFIFELGFGLGAYSYFKQNKKVDSSVEQDFDRYLNNSRLGKDNITSRYRSSLKDLSKEEVEDNVLMLMWKGFISGYNFCREFIENKTGLKDYKLEYFQANFSDPINEEEQRFKDDFLKKSLKLQLGIDISLEELDILLGKGEFFQADLIIMISQREKRHMLVVDNAISLYKLTDLNDIDEIKKSLQSTLFKKRQKNKFDNLSVDIGAVESLEIREVLSEYIIALNKMDKPLFKLIQAGSYAFSFRKFLERKKFIGDKDIKSVTVVGYTDEDINSLSISDENINFLKEMDSTLKRCNEFYKSADRSGKASSFKDKKRYTFNRLRSNFKEMFEIRGKLSDFIDIGKGINYISIKDDLDKFQNTVEDYKHRGSKVPFREAHAREVLSQLENKRKQFLFLTGNPGIGKTHAIVDYLSSQDSYIFLYLSPRIQVNKDIEKKFKRGDRYYSDEFIYLSASGEDEKIIDSKEVNVVNFGSNNKNIFDGVNSAIEFKDIDRERDYSNQDLSYRHRSSEEYSEIKSNRKGVLARLSMGIETVIEKRISKKIVATASIQALKMTGRGSTGKHIARIFSQIINRKTRAIDSEGFNKFVSDYKNIVIMVDEITGDSAGVALLDEVTRVVYEMVYSGLSLEQKNMINIKIVVADASIMDVGIVDKHIRNNSVDTDKIYYKLLEDNFKKPLDVQEFKFRNKYDSVYINSNAYPAGKLGVEYNITINMLELRDDIQKYDAVEKKMIDDKIVKNSFKHVSQGTDQVIIYIQDINRLRKTINLLDDEYRKHYGRSLKKYRDYIEIHSSISDVERDLLFKYRDDVSYVFMTSSASRGISFPKASKFLVDLPAFSVELNLMEILQLIYRGRGYIERDSKDKKDIEFYIGSSAYYEGDFEVKSNEIMTTIMTTMMILKASILTRINGGLKLGKNNIAIIPIGSKSIESGESMSLDAIGALLRDISRELNRGLESKDLEDIFKILLDIFKSVRLELGETIFLEKKTKDKFISRWKEGLINLTSFKPLKEAYILGDIAIFKLSKPFEGSVNLSSEKINTIKRSNLIERLRSIATLNKEVPNTIKINASVVANILEFFIKESRGRSMKFTDESERGYIAIPLITPLTKQDTLIDESKGSQNSDSMRNIIEAYVRSEYQIRDVYPFTDKYSSYPFIFFKSNSLESLRSSLFNGRHVLCSKEINLLKLIISK